MQDIHEIKPPVLVGMDPALVKILAMVAGCLVLAVLLFLLYKKFRKRKGPGKQDPPIPSTPPYDEALNALDRLAARKNLDPKFFYFELAGLLKTYISRSYAIHASEMTTQELARHLRTTAMDRNLLRRVVKFQDMTDPFRYGPVVEAPGRIRQDWEEARQLVQALEQDLEKTREPVPGQDKGRDGKPDRPETPGKRRSLPYTKILDCSDNPGQKENA